MRNLHLSEAFEIYSYRHPHIAPVWQEKVDYIKRSIGGGKIVICGLKSTIDSLRYIYAGFYVMLKKLDLSFVWLENLPQNVMGNNTPNTCVILSGAKNPCRFRPV